MARALSLAASAVALLALFACVAVAAPEADKVTSVPDYGPITSNMYAGYLNATDGRKAFYTFVESTGTPANDPLVLWLNGGPGCSSMLGFFEENGPITMRHGGQFQPNAFAWNQLASVLYIESPGGVGFSIDTTPATAWDDDKAAAFNFAALNSFLKKFPEFAANKLYLTGESYAGFYIPELAYTILTQGSPALQAQMQGYMVGNPCTGQIGCCNPDPFIDPFLQYNGFRPMQDQVPVDPKARYDPYDLLEPSCATGSVLNRVRFPHPVVDALRKRVGNPPYAYGPCANDYVTKWLNRADVKAALHADASITWSSCSNNIQYTCNLNGVVPMYREMMKKTNWSILVYSGLDDSVVNQAQTQTIVHDMGSPLAVQQFQAWYRPDVYNSSLHQLGGFFLQYERISWAGVRNSGHMVPEYNPPSGLELFKSYLTLGRPGRLHD